MHTHKQDTKMKLNEVIKRLIRTRDNEADPDIDLFAQDLNVYGAPVWSETFNNRVKGWYVNSWLCTDTEVGTAVYFFDDKPVAVGVQTARKSRESLYFLDKASADSMRIFLLELIREEDNQFAQYIDPELEDIPEFHSYSYSKQCGARGRKGIWRGQPIMVSRIFHGYNFDRSPGNPRCDEIEIELPDGNKIIVDCSEVLFRINVV